MKPKRSDPIYKEIESFEPYELSQCIAYEMAIRSPGEMARIKKIQDYYQEHKTEIQEAKKLGYPDYFLSEHFNALLGLLRGLVTLPLRWGPESTWLRWGLERTPAFDLEIEGEYRDKRLEGVYRVIDEIKGEAPSSNSPGIKELSRFLRGVGAGLDDLIAPLPDRSHIETREEVQGKGYKVIQWAIAPDTEEPDSPPPIGWVGASIAMASFRRPMLRVAKQFKRGPIMTIDLSRPMNELLAYVEHVKTDIDRKKERLRSPFELLTGELEAGSDREGIGVKKKNGKTDYLDRRNGPGLTRKYADMFFIYDALQSGMGSLMIRTEISEYYQQMGKTTEMSENTFLKYKRIAEDSIEKEHYWELITGTQL